jgi:hypothetical protein
MRRLLSLFALAAATSLPPADALAASPPSGNFGLGLGGGLGVSGLSGKYYMGDATAFQGIVGTSFRGGGGGLGVGLDYLLERPSFAGGDPVQLGWNLGVGGTLGLAENYLGVGASGVLGLEILLQPLPIDFVIEYRPGVFIIPNFGMDLVNFSGHIRYYFG